LSWILCALVNKSPHVDLNVVELPPPGTSRESSIRIAHAVGSLLMHRANALTSESLYKLSRYWIDLCEIANVDLDAYTCSALIKTDTNIRIKYPETGDSSIFDDRPGAIGMLESAGVRTAPLLRRLGRERVSDEPEDARAVLFDLIAAYERSLFLTHGEGL